MNASGLQLAAHRCLARIPAAFISVAAASLVMPAPAAGPARGGFVLGPGLALAAFCFFVATAVPRVRLARARA
jgi:hypothetical protein